MSGLPYTARLLGDAEYAGRYVAQPPEGRPEDWPNWTVVRANGERFEGLLNLLRFPDGQMFAVREVCEQIAAAANRRRDALTPKGE